MQPQSVAFKLFQLLARTTFGALIGTVTAAIAVAVDYLGQTERGLYWVDHGDSAVAVATLGIITGAAVGFAWGVAGIRRSKKPDAAVKQE